MTGTAQSKIQQSLTPAIDEFVTDLRSFATGSYLRDSERELWEQPFPPAAVDDIHTALLEFLASLDSAVALAPVVSADSAASGEQATNSEGVVDGVVDDTVTKLRQINAKYGDAVLEAEEFEELSQIMAQAVELAGGKAEDVQSDIFTIDPTDGD